MEVVSPFKAFAAIFGSVILLAIIICGTLPEITVGEKGLEMTLLLFIALWGFDGLNLYNGDTK